MIKLLYKPRKIEMHAQWSGQEMAGKIRKLPLLATAFMVVCLVAAGFLQFYVITPLMALASTDTVVPNAKGASSGLFYIPRQGTNPEPGKFSPKGSSIALGVRTTDAQLLV